MRLFITKQSYRSLKVSGHAEDDWVAEMDKAELAFEDSAELNKEIELSNHLVVSISDCDYWDGSPEELFKLFEADVSQFDDPKNSNELFRKNRATLALRYLHRLFPRTYEVSVEKRMYCTGIYRIEANSPEEAQEEVDKMIEKGYLQTTAIDWDNPQYEDMSFCTTGDID